uniref:Uncharacterized protein n=1 Tax=Solanum lycopersicum TaxID=4081 RepID=A0A3Q7HGZ6_SOLLC
MQGRTQISPLIKHLSVGDSFSRINTAVVRPALFPAPANEVPTCTKRIRGGRKKVELNKGQSYG